MKKQLFLLLLVLGLSSTAWGYCLVNVSAEQQDCDGPVNAQMTLCCSGDCSLRNADFCRWGNVIYADVYLDCTCTAGCSRIQRTANLEERLGSDLCCGLYILVVRVWCEYDACCWPYCMFGQPVFCGMGSTSFRVCCDDACCCFPCFPCFPCCPSPGGNTVVTLR